MIKNIGITCNSSYAHRKFTHHHIVQKNANTKSDKNIYDNKSKSSKSSRSNNNSKAAGITKLRNYQIKTKKSFTALNTRIEDMENEDSKFNDSDDNEEDNS